jgi:hypothetical protein
MKDPDWIPEQDVNNNNNNQNLIERNNLETDESRDNQNDAERVFDLLQVLLHPLGDTILSFRSTQ